MSIATRLEEIAKSECNSVRAFELSIGKKSGYLNMMKKNNGSPSTSVVEDIIRLYPIYNLHWIVTGNGNKFIETLQDSLSEPEEIYKKQIIENDFLGLSKRIDVVIKQNNEILDKLTRSMAKDILKEEKAKVLKTLKNS